MERRIRVVHILPDLGSGGAEQQVLVMVRGLDRDVFEPVVVCTHEFGALEPAFRETGCRLIRIGKKSRYDLRILPKLVRALRDLRPDVIHTSLFSSSFWGRLAALFLRPRPIIVVSEHSTDYWKTVPYRMVDRVLARWTDAVYAVSTAVRRFNVEFVGLPERLVEWIWCGIDLDRAQKHIDWTDAKRADRRRELGIPDDALVLGWIGRPSNEKRLDILAEVVARVHECGVAVRLLLIGREPENEEQRTNLDALLRTLEERGAREAVVRRGFVIDVSAEYAIMDTLVQTSDWEGLPNVVIEAGAMEVPTVATNAGGTGDIIEHRVSGWLVPTGDVDGVTEGILHVHEHREEAAAWGSEARRRAETLFSQKAFIDAITHLYARLLRQRGATVPEALRDA